MSTTGDRTAGLRAARTADSTTKRGRALSAIDALEAAGGPITAAAVAKAAGVSTWLVYADGIREHFQAARTRHTNDDEAHALSPSARREPVSESSLRTDLAIAHDEIRRLRAEHDTIRKRLRLQLGAEIEAPDHAELITRVTDLETTNRTLIAERDARATEADLAQRRVTELEDELTAARESLRRAIRQANR